MPFYYWIVLVLVAALLLYIGYNSYRSYVLSGVERKISNAYQGTAFGEYCRSSNCMWYMLDKRIAADNFAVRYWGTDHDLGVHIIQYGFVHNVSILYPTFNAAEKYFLSHCSPENVRGNLETLVAAMRSNRMIGSDSPNVLEVVRSTPELVHAYMDIMFDRLQNCRSIHDKLEWKQKWEGLRLPFKPNSAQSEALGQLEGDTSDTRIEEELSAAKDELMYCRLDSAVASWLDYSNIAKSLGKSEESLAPLRLVFARGVILRLQRRDAEVSALTRAQVEEIYNTFGNGIHYVNEFFP